MSRLNSRFDRMVHSLNLSHSPMDDCRASRDNLGAHFSAVVRHIEPRPPLPRWLAETFSTLGSDHPLRLLLPPCPEHQREPVNAMGLPSIGTGFGLEAVEPLQSADEQPPFSIPPSDPLALDSPLPRYGAFFPVSHPPHVADESETIFDPIEDALYIGDFEDLPLTASESPIFGYMAHKNVYFDSPADDPVLSDPLDIGYQVEELDFRWEPFIQKESQPPPALEIPLVAEGVRSRIDEPVPAEEKEFVSPRFAFLPLVEASAPTPCTPVHAPAPVQRPKLKFFAPAPGIFISPLRDDHMASQTSNDSIEDWDDEH
ncbi:hypothetical protein HMN09_01369500 [Mycena chlorophos]|uniref:Uncharacterized protein n=1 Tax=Mycena chlorophos TaxID=658473 RepID=A0A8H6RXB0_MYCCL|nr:hypothetical protein HMN09_01369500 [Mycena chlorophos]